MSTTSKLREEMVDVARSLYDRGYTHGSTGNISVPVDDGWLVTPTGSSMGQLDPARLSLLDAHGELVSGDPPTKETFLHLAMYRGRPRARAVVHLHAGHSVGLSCLPCPNPHSCLPKLTAYAHMQCGDVALLPYYRPGDMALADAVGAAASRHWSILLAHHGPVVAGKSLKTAMYAIEELEETAKLAIMLRGQAPETLSQAQLDDLDQHFPPWD